MLSVSRGLEPPSPRFFALCYMGADERALVSKGSPALICSPHRCFSAAHGRRNKKEKPRHTCNLRDTREGALVELPVRRRPTGFMGAKKTLGSKQVLARWVGLG